MLTYTWAQRGQQPQVKISGQHRGYKVFGLSDYFTGRFFYQGPDGRLNSVAYIAFLRRVLQGENTLLTGTYWEKHLLAL